MKTKTLSGELKFIPTDGSRTGTAVVYVFKGVDQDPILDELFTRRDDLKLRWNHGLEPGDILGRVTAIRILPDRVEADFKLFETPEADRVYELMLTGGVTEFSVGYTFSEDNVYKAKDGRWHVRRAELTEVSAVSAGANRETMLVSIKSVRELEDLPPEADPEPELQGVKAGRTLSAKNEAALRGALNNIASAIREAEGVLAALGGLEVPQIEPEKVLEAPKTSKQDELRQALTLLTADVI